MSLRGSGAGRPTLSENVQILQNEVAMLTGLIEHLIRKIDSGPTALTLNPDQSASMNATLVSANDEAPTPVARDLMRRPRPALPDPRLVHRIMRQRQLRSRYFEPELFADPAWDMLLDLAAARAEYRRVSVTSLCIAAAVPPTTALRWIGQMTAMGILVREQDEEDKRRAFIALSNSAADCMARYFDEIGSAAKLLT